RFTQTIFDLLFAGELALLDGDVDLVWHPLKENKIGRQRLSSNQTVIAPARALTVRILLQQVEHCGHEIDMAHRLRAAPRALAGHSNKIRNDRGLLEHQLLTEQAGTTHHVSVVAG